MNQILSTSMPMDNDKNRTKNNYKNNKQPIAMKSILKFFTVVMLIFGAFMIGTGAYAIYKNQSGQEVKKLDPSIALENKTDTTILLKVTHSVNIQKVEYRWNEGKVTTINGNNGKYLDAEISIPSGTNTLHILVQDESGYEMTYERIYELESKINLEVANNKILVTYDSEQTISYMTYRWDDEQEEKIEINDTVIEQEIEALKGLHTLTIVVVDEDNNTDTKQQKINGVSKPEVEAGIDDEREHFVITASDDEKITKLEYRINQDDAQKYEINLEDKDLNALEYKLPTALQMGENLLEVKVYNSKGITNETAVRYFKQ